MDYDALEKRLTAGQRSMLVLPTGSYALNSDDVRGVLEAGLFMLVLTDLGIAVLAANREK